MQNEILKPVLDTDEVAVPRYDIVGPNGSVIQQNVELRLKNEVVQEGTPYDEESVLPTSLREQLELPQSATPAEAFAQMLKVSGGAVSHNRAPTASDAQTSGKIWMVPRMVFNNLMPNTLSQVASNWQSGNATATASGRAVTLVGDGSDSTVIAQASMLSGARAGDKVFVQASVRVDHDANSSTIQLMCGEQVLATKTLDVPTAGDSMLLQAVASVESTGDLTLRVQAAYNTAAVQSGKGVTVSDITVWNMTADMCQNDAELEFSEAEAAQYITEYGAFQTREYELSMLWWVCRGKLGTEYQWLYFNQFVDDLDADLQGQIDTHNRVYANMLAQGLGYKKITFKCVDAQGNEYFGVPVQCDLNDCTYVCWYDRLVMYINVHEYTYHATGTFTVVVPSDLVASGATSFVVDVTNTDDAEIVLSCTPKDTQYTITSSVEALIFSGRVQQATLWMCGGGGSGAVGRSNNNQSHRVSGSGGGGGYTAQKTFNIVPGANLGVLTIGAGGGAQTGSWSGTSAGATAGKDGGTSSLVAPDGTTLLSAAGGKGGTARSATSDGALTGAAGGSGAGGVYCSTTNDKSYIGAGGSNGSDGAAGSSAAGGEGQGTTTYPFGDTSLPLCCSAGGGALAYNLNAYKTGTGGSGASNGVTGNTEGATPTSSAPTTHGSGSGAAVGYYNGSGSGGTKTAAGKAGICYVRLTLRTA